MKRRLLRYLGKLPSSLLVLMSLASLSNHSQAATYVWNASSGLFPDQVPTMTLSDFSSPEDPQLSSGVLTLFNDSALERMYYESNGDNLVVPDHITITSEMRVVSSTSSNSARAGAAIEFSTAAGIGNLLWVGNGEIFLLSAGLVRGDSAAVNTVNFHLYRIEVSGASSGSTIQVFQDDVLKLNGSLFTDTGTNGSVPRVGFGEVSGLASGTSEWKSFTHNLSAIPEPLTSFPLPVVCLSGILLNRRRRR